MGMSKELWLACFRSFGLLSPTHIRASGNEIVFRREIVARDAFEASFVGGSVVIGRGATLGRDCRIALNGGKLVVGEGCTIKDGVDFVCAAQVSIGSHVTLERMSSLQSDFGAPIEIGDGSSVGQGSRVWAHTGPIRIGSSNNVGRHTDWIGTGEGITTGSNCDFGVCVTMDSAGGFIRFGTKSGIGPNGVVYGHGGAEIGNGCAIAGLTMIVPGNHRFADTDRPLREQGVDLMPIRIGDDVWIGAGVTVLGNTVIGDRSVIAAGTVARGDIAPNTVLAGVPGRPIRRRHAKTPSGLDELQAVSASASG